MIMYLTIQDKNGKIVRRKKMVITTKDIKTKEPVKDESAQKED